MSYKETINLPKTKFSMKARLAELEPRIQKKWDEMRLYEKLRQSRAGRPKYVLHDGPPYPTGDLHLGTGLNKVLKDFLVRYHSMHGRDAPFVPGWDCHGLPIEVKVLEELGRQRESAGTSGIRRKCRRYAEKYLELQKQQFRSLGVAGDWSNPYLTLDTGYEAGTLEVFAELVGNGYVYRDLKPVHWCHHCRTVLAEAEIEYSETAGPSIFVNFPALRHSRNGSSVDPFKLFDLKDDDRVNLLIWTTTPWTLPANLAIAVHPQADYVAVRYRHPATGENTVSILSARLAPLVLPDCGVDDYQLLGKVEGNDLIGMQYLHPFMDRENPVLPAGYVTLSDGTGCVHTAPGHGLEDYATGLEHGLDILSPVDEKGFFTGEAGPFAGQHIDEAGPEIVDWLVQKGHMLHSERTVHSYPHCWRCHRPVIFRATNQWFLRMDHENLRDRTLDAVQDVQWVPEWGEKRMRQMLDERPDWCLSRQKSWGVPIPAFYCNGCGEVLLTKKTVLHVADVFAANGSDSWFEADSAEPFLPDDTVCPGCGARDWSREQDIFDVWFESGSSHHSVLRKREGLQFPADVYLEGTDQYRGWFQLSLLPSMAAWNEPPYRTVLTHGFVVDDKGNKMSKSAGNFIGVNDAVKEFHAEILRLWALSVDYRNNINVSETYIKDNMVDAYRRIRNTFRFLLGNLADFDPDAHALPHEELEEFDRWALDQTARLVEGLEDAWDNYDLHKVYGLLHNFCAVQMSSVYFDALKDRLYCSAPGWRARRSAQTALHNILLVLVKACAPVLVHTAEEVWSHVRHRDEEAESIHLCHWPQTPRQWLDEQLNDQWTRILAVRSELARCVEKLREEKEVSNNMDVVAVLWAQDRELHDLLSSHKDTLMELLMVSELKVPEEQPHLNIMTGKYGVRWGEKERSLYISVDRSEHPKCARCWNLRPTVGASENHPDLCRRCCEAVSEPAHT